MHCCCQTTEQNHAKLPIKNQKNAQTLAYVKKNSTFAADFIKWYFTNLQEIIKCDLINTDKQVQK